MNVPKSEEPQGLLHISQRLNRTGLKETRKFVCDTRMRGILKEMIENLKKAKKKNSVQTAHKNT